MRKRIEVAILGLLAVVLGVYVYDRIGIRMGGTPSSIQSPFATEEDWFLDAIVRALAEVAAYARGATDDRIELTLLRSPAGALELPSVEVQVRIGDSVVSNRRLSLSGSFWNPDNYSELARELLGTTPPSPATRSANDAPGVLLDLRPGVLVQENKRISGRLAADILDASAHEEAALLLGAFGLREAAYGFDDTRGLLLRMTAHLALARALRGDDAGSPARSVAEAALHALTGRQVDLLEALDGLERRSDSSRSWRSALYMYSTDDWRTAAPSESLLVQLMRFRALAAALGSSNAIDRVRQSTESELADWGRILTWLTARDVATRGFIETQLARELAEIQEVASSYGENVGSPSELADALNELPDGLVGPDGPRVLPWGLWAAFFQRHLSAALVVRDEHYREALGLPDEAVSFGREAERAFSGLRLNPIVQVRRSRYVGARVEDTVGMDAAIALTRRHPELVNPTQWRNLEDTAAHMMRKRGMPRAASWLSANVLVTGLLDSAWARFDILEPTIDRDQARQRMAAIAPMHTFAIRDAVRRLEEGGSRFDELSARLGERLEFDRQALRTLLRAARSEDDRLGVMGRMCELDANECDRLGWELVDAARTAEAADAFQRMVDRAPGRVEVCNSADWLVNYYFDQGRAGEAIAVANVVAEVYCSWGLQTKACLLERMGRVVEAERWYRANEERYDAEDAVSYPLLGFYYRMARVAEDGDYEARFQDHLSRVFPRGLEPLPSELDASAPVDGVLIDGTSSTLERAGIRGGDVIVGLDGWRVRSLEQYDAVRAFLPRTGGARVLDLTLWRQSAYLEAETNSRNRRLYVKVRTYGTPGPSVHER